MARPRWYWQGHRPWLASCGQQGHHRPGERLRRDHRQARDANNPVIPAAWRGLVYARSVFSRRQRPEERAALHVRHLGREPDGEDHRIAPSKQSVNTHACYFSDAVYVDFDVVGSQSTGGFAGTSGPGAVEVYFAGYGPKYKSGPKKGQCNMNAPELAKGAVASFLLSAVLTKR